MAGRTPTQEWGDLHLRVNPAPSERTTYGQAVFKITYAIDPFGGPLTPTTPRPLVNDLQEEDCDPPIPAHSDFWPSREWTDVAVLGSAHAPEGRSVPDMIAGLRVGRRRRLLRVHGDREIRFRRDGSPEIGPAEPFRERPLGLEHAYGGLDLRAWHDRDDPEQAAHVALGSDWPGLYPRNPWGRGYLCSHLPVEGLAMPSQEDAADPLTAARLVVQPELWYRQPMPGHLGWLPVNCFPRSIFFSIDCDPWHPPPEDGRLPEIAQGLLPETYRTLLDGNGLGAPAHWRFVQESAPGLAFRRRELETAPITVVGMHPVHPVLSFYLPPRPEVKLAFATAREVVEPALHCIEILPGELLASLTYTASIAAPRLFLPTVHETIPFGVIVGGKGPVWYDAPPTLKKRLAAAEAAKEDAP